MFILIFSLIVSIYSTKINEMLAIKRTYKYDCVLQRLVFYNCAINTITQGTITNRINADHRATEQYLVNTGGSILYCNILFLLIVSRMLPCTLNTYRSTLIHHVIFISVRRPDYSRMCTFYKKKFIILRTHRRIRHSTRFIINITILAIATMIKITILFFRVATQISKSNVNRLKFKQRFKIYIIIQSYIY